MIHIESNGSKWFGQAPDDIPTLLGVLNDPQYTLETWTGNPVRKVSPGVATFFGNFREVSHVFNITTDEPTVIRDMVAAIRANRARRFAKAKKGN